MIKFWLIATLIFIVTTYILTKFTLKEQRKEAGEKIWKTGYGRSTYWRILSLCSFGITAVIMLILHYYLGISIV